MSPEPIAAPSPNMLPETIGSAKDLAKDVKETRSWLVYLLRTLSVLGVVFIGLLGFTLFSLYFRNEAVSTDRLLQYGIYGLTTGVLSYGLFLLSQRWQKADETGKTYALKGDAAFWRGEQTTYLQSAILTTSPQQTSLALADGSTAIIDPQDTKNVTLKLARDATFVKFSLADGRNLFFTLSGAAPAVPLLGFPCTFAAAFWDARSTGEVVRALMAVLFTRLGSPVSGLRSRNDVRSRQAPAIATLAIIWAGLGVLSAIYLANQINAADVFIRGVEVTVVLAITVAGLAVPVIINLRTGHRLRVRKPDAN